MKLTITSVDTIHWDGEVDSVTVPGVEGEMTILSGHMPLISLLSSGTVVLKSSAGPRAFTIESGMIDISRDRTTILI